MFDALQQQFYSCTLQHNLMAHVNYIRRDKEQGQWHFLWHNRTEPNPFMVSRPSQFLVAKPSR